ncbi:asparagine synthase (glutamine-hydrolyzing) [Xanthomarina sp. F2636L]|uniref:asparagine synthase (glutamine-hydrolyzing) n=1 Tax=Xanthomarina sp. F2636L TaxID=2996018 RepID=UPI00225E2D3E|nr:asparagine synthase (glutamine-hydrolyzing) [Xanthomarina sp. F2636L]MCX7549507.1 asparagine synthase (glutamine-hydrolyzing) [Xanthomarina sp. F2636L]
MCGIYGSTIAYNNAQIKEKLERSKFRGPDKLKFEHFGKDNHVIFGHNRLAIIDLDERSNQPFTYRETIHLVFNGEIYNFMDIKNTLTEKGYKFNTTSDTEVICAAYLEYGEDCVNHFNGMFAFVIFDQTKNTFFGARDRLGQKPFYYYQNGKDFEFASQLSVVQLYNENLSISKKAISLYLAWGVIPDPYSIFNEIKKLPAGHSFTFDLNTNKFKEKAYWDIDYQGKKQFKGSFDEAVNILDTTLKDAVKIRLFADVPVGIFLSGGVDSSVIAALATKSTNSKVKTFSVKFNEKGFDESVYAQQVADHLETDHHVIECNYEEGKELIKNFCHFYDEPFSDSSAIPSMLLAKHTREKVTVALSGDAGDESFIGYHRYEWIKKGQKINMLPLFFRKICASILRLSSNYRMKIIAKAMTYKNTNDVYLASMTNLDFTWIDSQTDFYDLEEVKYLKHKKKNIFERITDFDLKSYLIWDINTKVDRATMAFSLEARAPLLDYRVVEFARSLPTSFKFKGKNQKRILKEVLYQYVPKHIFDRPKSGFSMPFSEWFKTDLKSYVLEELSDENLKEIPCIHPEIISGYIKQHMDGSWNRFSIIWQILVLKQWLDNNGKGYPIK